MDDNTNTPTGPEFYVLSDESYEQLLALQILLSLIADTVHEKDDDPNAVLTIPRASLRYYFQQISNQIGDALKPINIDKGLSRHKRKLN
jgi:hypothetical protein